MLSNESKGMPKKKVYVKPTIKSTKIEDVIMLASGRAGMGMCKITFE